MLERILDILIGAAAVQGFFLATVLAGNKKGNRRANVFLCLLLVAFSLVIIHSTFMAGYFGELYGNPLGMKEPHVLLLGPLFYFYVRELASGELRFRVRDLVHFIPYAAFFMVVASVNIHGRDSAYSRLSMDHPGVVTTAMWGMTLTLFLFYAHRVADITGIHGKRMEEEYSSLGNVGLGWVRKFMAAFTFFFAVLTVVFIVRMHGHPDYFNRIAATVMAVIVYLAGYRGLRQPDIFIRSAQASEQPGDDAGSRPVPAKYKTSGLTPEDMDGIEASIRKHMDEEKPFLDPDFCLNALADRVGVSKNGISQVLNTKIGANFFNFVNLYRVVEVKQLLNDPRRDDHTLLAVAFEAGFDSKATFNSIFKRFTGVTPSDYRKSIKKTV